MPTLKFGTARSKVILLAVLMVIMMVLPACGGGASSGEASTAGDVSVKSVADYTVLPEANGSQYPRLVTPNYIVYNNGDSGIGTLYLATNRDHSNKITGYIAEGQALPVDECAVTNVDGEIQVTGDPSKCFVILEAPPAIPDATLTVLGGSTNVLWVTSNIPLSNGAYELYMCPEWMTLSQPNLPEIQVNPPLGITAGTYTCVLQGVDLVTWYENEYTPVIITVGG